MSQTQVSEFLQGGGEMGALMRAQNWAQSTLGPSPRWPQSLRAMVRLILNTGHPMYIWWGHDGACLYNDAYRALIGPERHPGSLGRPAREVWSEIWPIIGPQIDQVMEGRGPTWKVNHLVPITRQGRLEDAYWTYSYSPIDDPHARNGIGGVLVVCSETTEQVLLATRLVAERDQLGMLFEQAPSFMALLRGPDHIFEIMNPGYQRLVGHRQLVGKPVAEGLPEAVELGFTELLDQVYASGVAFFASGRKWQMQAPSGGHPVERFIDFVYQPIRGPDGKVNGIFVEGVDVTARALADAALRDSEMRYRELAGQLSEASRRKDEFLATLAHELRNPLAPIRLSLSMQKLAPDDKQIAASTREVMERQLAQMVRLIDDLFDVSRLSRGTVELSRAPLLLSGALIDAVETSRPAMEQSGHELKLTLPEDRLVIEADATRLVQVFSNLLNNAAKFTRRGGHIELGLRREGANAVAFVRDDGEGIAPEMLLRVFDMFTQVDRSHTRGGGGLGIGLTLVKHMVELHGGTVEARSAGPGRGSEFIVTLPLAASPLDLPAVEGPLAVEPVQRKKVLVADDNEDASESLSMALTLSGHETRVANDGEQAFALAREFQPDVMLLDIAMPLLDGHGLARRIRAQPWGRGMMLIAISGWGQAEDARKSREAGFDHHLVKPVEFENVNRLLAQQP